MHVNPAEFTVTVPAGNINHELRGPENVFDFDYVEPMGTYFFSQGPSILQVDTMETRRLRCGKKSRHVSS